jgi:caffeoyl-CoA O-methyltransferase
VCLARALPSGGFLHTFEFEAKHAKVAAETFKLAKVADRVKIHVGPALEKLAAIEKDGPFDLVFIDADKVSYPAYLAWAAENLRVGGAVLADNTFAWGMIHEDPSRIEDAEDRASVEALRRFNETVASNPGWRATALPTAEGLTLAVKTG